MRWMMLAILYLLSGWQIGAHATPAMALEAVEPRPSHVSVNEVSNPTRQLAAAAGTEPVEAKRIESFKDCDQCPEMVVIPPGSFLMGSPDTELQRLDSEGPQHLVTISRPFALGKYEVTFEEWDACVAAGACENRHMMDRGWGRGRRPVILISWNDAQAYAAWLSSITGNRYRLPSESEWEYAARAGTTTPFYTGHTVSTEQANFDCRSPYSGSNAGEFRRQTLPAGTFPPNAFGLHDVHGNIEEYVADCWNRDYNSAPADGSAWLEGNCKLRVQRDGDWKHPAANARSAMRYSVHPAYGRETYGMRMARDIVP